MVFKIGIVNNWNRLLTTANNNKKQVPAQTGQNRCDANLRKSNITDQEVNNHRQRYQG